MDTRIDPLYKIDGNPGVTACFSAMMVEMGSQKCINKNACDDEASY